MITKTKLTLLTLVLVLAGCASDTSPPKKDTMTSVQIKCAVILSSHLPEEQHWPDYDSLLQEYYTHKVNDQASRDRFNAFMEAVQQDETKQLMTELMEVTDWGCANGNYLEEMDLFIREVQK